MESIRSVFESALTALKGRLLNPFYVAYILAWGALNFRLILVLASAGTSQVKIAYIDQILYPHWQTGLMRGLVLPFAAAVIYVLSSPYVFRWVTLYQRKVEKKTVEQVLEVLGETPMSKPQADRLRANLKDLKARHEQELSIIRAEIDQLQEQNDRLLLEKGTRNSSSQSDSASESASELHAQDSEAITTKHKRMRFSESEFAGIAVNVYAPLLRRGISISELETLYAVRNESHLTFSDFSKFFPNVEEFKVMALLELLIDLNLMERVPQMPRPSYRISKLGRMTIKLGVESGYIGLA